MMLHSSLLRAARDAAAAAFALVAVTTFAQAVEIERVVSPGGVEAWLVNEPAVPLVSVAVGFRGGAAQDPEALPGVANMVSMLLDQGAGELDSQAFQTRLRDLNVELNFDAGRDAFEARMRTLSMNLEDGFELLRLALAEPRFDADAVERQRSRVAASLRRSLQDPNSVASREFAVAMFGPDHPYGRPVDGTLDSVADISVDDLRAYHAANLARDNIHIAVVGDIDAETLKPLLDLTFGDLPETADLAPVPDPDIEPRDEELVTVLGIPQTVMRFGRPGLERHDEDFMAAVVANHILGGGSFTSRLFHEVRDQRGLAYGVFSFLQTMDRAGLFVGGVATRNDRAAESLSLIRQEVHRMATEGPTEEELDKAKRYLTGSYALRFESSGQIARQLVHIQLDELGIDYINVRNDLIEAVTVEDARRAAARLLGDGALLVTIVGEPEGFAADGANGG